MIRNKKIKSFINVLFTLVLIVTFALILPENVKAATGVNDVTELQNAVKNASNEEVITLSEGFTFADARIEMPNVDTNVTIDGGNKVWNNGTIIITGEGAGSLTIKNLEMDGTSYKKEMLKNEITNGTLVLENMEFYNSTTGGAIWIDTMDNANMEINRTRIYNNTALNKAPGIWISGDNEKKVNLTINNSTIENNTGTGGSYATGAIASKNYNGNLVINNTVFKNNINKSIGNDSFGGGGGAIAIQYFHGHITINESLFEGNETNGEDVPIKKSYDGGAIYIFDGQKGATFDVNKSTFVDNIAYDGGGAIYCQGTYNPGLTTNITNSTFYNNKAYGLGQSEYAGGAIQFFKNGGSAKMDNIILSSTFVGNQAGSEDSKTEERGGAISLTGVGMFAIAAITRNDSLFIGNKVFNANGEDTTSNYKDISNSTAAQVGTYNVINVDKGTATTHTAEDVLGKNNIGLSVNQSDIKAGVDDEIVKTIPIKPEGIADNTYSGTKETPTDDQRGYIRVKDQGAVESAWIKYNAAGGVFDTGELKGYDGTVYYEGEKPTDYYTVGGIGKEVNIVDGKTVLNPTKDGFVFKGWTIDPDKNEVDPKYEPGTELKYTNEGLTLYAVWGKEFKISYAGNESTSGEVPVDENSPYFENEIVKVLSKGNLAKENYTFVTWNTKADGTGESYAEGSNIKLIEDTVLYAQWIENNKYTVTYDGNLLDLGEVVDLDEHYEGAKVTVKDKGNLIRYNYTFVNWNTKADGTGTEYKPGDVFEISSNIILYAQWKENEKFTISYDANGGTGKQPGLTNPHYVDSELTVLDEGTMEMKNHTFSHWNTKTDGTGDSYKPGEKIIIKGETILYAQWKENEKFTISYNGNGADRGNVEDTNQYYKDTEIVIKDNEFEKDGYLFVSWNTSADGNGSEYFEGELGVIGGNVTLYAQWEKEEIFKVTYDGNENTSGTAPIDSKEYYIGDDAIVLGNGDLAREGYTFVGWNTSADGTGIEYIEGSIMIILDDTTLYAKWEENSVESHTAKFNSNGGSVVADQIVADGEVATEPTTPTKDGYIFKGWYTDVELTTVYDFATPVTKDITLYAKWEAEPTVEHTVTFDSNGGSTVASQTVANGEVATEPGTPRKDGYIFEGWYTDVELTTAYDFATPVTKDIILYAKWEVVPVGNHVVTFDSDDGNVIAPQMVADGGTIEKPADPVKDGYTFIEWQLDGAPYDFTTPITEDITLMAVWEANPVVPTNYTVSYDGNGHTGGTVPVDLNLYTLDDPVIVLPKGDLYKDGFNFKGWNTKADGSGTQYNAGDTFKITENTILYAQWKKESEDSGTGWTWSGGSSTTSKEKPKVEEILTHMAYLSGYPDNTIRPQGSITRAEVAAIFARLKVGEANIPSGSTNYGDVNSSDWYTKYIAFVTDNNIMKGYEDGSFQPNDKITRAEFTAVVARYNALVNVESSFEDVSGHWAEKYIGAVTSKGWINGYPDGTFKPEKDISREEVATMVNKMLDRKVDKDGLNNLGIKNFKDLDDSNWSYFDIVEASNSHRSVRRTLGNILEDWKEFYNITN